MQSTLNKFFVEMDDLNNIPTASAYCQSRDKLNPILYKEMSNKSVSDFYRLYNGGKSWNGKRVIGLDCSKLNLLNTLEIREKYSTKINEIEENNQCISSFLYDIFNEVTLNASFDKLKGEKYFLLEEHINYLKKTDILLMDRAYADYSIMTFLISKGIDLVIRFPSSNTFKSVEEFLLSDETEKIIELNVSKAQKKFVIENNLSEKIQVRFIKIELTDGKVEILATTLFEENMNQIKEFYGFRWGIETYFDRLKNIFELERFSGKKINCFEQDFYGLVFLTNLESILIKDSEEEIKSKTKNRKLKYKVNRNLSYSAMIDYICELFFSPNLSHNIILEHLNILFETNPVIIRPGRNYQRKKLSHARKLRANLYEKRVSS